MCCIFQIVCPKITWYYISALWRACTGNGSASINYFSYADSILKDVSTFLNFPVGNHSFTSSMMWSVWSTLKPRGDWQIRKFNYLRTEPSFFFLWVWPPWPYSLLIIGWCGPNSRTAAIGSLDSGLFKIRILLFTFHFWPWSLPLSPLRYSPAPSSFSSANFPACTSLSPPLPSSPTVCCLFAPPPPRGRRLSPGGRPYDWLAAGVMLPLVICPESWCLMVCLPDLCGWWYLDGVWGEGCRRRCPPRWSWGPQCIFAIPPEG